MILPRLLQLLFVIFGLLCLVLPLCAAVSSSQQMASSSQLKTVEGKCLSFGKRNAMLKPCNDNDPNQMIHMTKLNSTLLVIHDYRSQSVMCYDTRARKVRVYNITRLVKNYQGDPAEVVEATRTRRKFECGIYESVERNGYVNFHFGNNETDSMVWKKNGLIVKAKDMLCSHQKERQSIRHHRSRNSPRSGRQRNRSASLEARSREAGKGSTIESRQGSSGGIIESNEGRKESSEVRESRTNQLAKRSAERRRQKQARRKKKNRSKGRNHKKRCRNVLKEKFGQFMYYKKPSL